MTKEFDKIMDSIEELSLDGKVLSIELSVDESVLLIANLNVILLNEQEEIEKFEFKLENDKKRFERVKKGSMSYLEKKFELTQLSFLIEVLNNNLKNKENFVNSMCEKIDGNGIDIVRELEKRFEFT